METTLTSATISNDGQWSMTASNLPPLSIIIQPTGSPILIISPNGDITWKDRVIEGDAEFREAVIGLYKYINGSRL